MTPWTVACQALLSMGFTKQEYYSGCHFLLQGIFPTQGMNLGLLHCRQILYQLSHQGSPCFTRALSQYLSYWEGAGNLLHSQIKLRVSTSTGDSRTGRDLPKFVCTPRGGRLVQGAAAGTKARIPHGVQSKEGSPLWVTITVAITVD